MQLSRLLLASLISLAACSRPDTAEPVPVPTTQSHATANAPLCIQQKITAILAEPVRNPPARILRYRYNGDTVFYLAPPCCDQMSELYDENCNLICHPDGGITGAGDGQCPAFWSTATDSAEIWRDPR